MQPEPERAIDWVKAADDAGRTGESMRTDRDYKIAVSGSEMSRIDAYTIEQMSVPALVLMERAALFVRDAVKDIAAEKDRIVAVCGTGNNGGDGVAAARMLFLEGYRVSVYLVDDRTEKYSEGLRAQLDIAVKMGLKVEKQLVIDENTVVIDAIFGTGLSRELREDHIQLIQEVNQADRIVAVDIPSGVHSANGRILGAAVKASTTVTFGFKKIGTLLYPGRSFAGEVKVCDIGFAPKAVCEIDPKTYYFDSVKLPKRRPDSNKGTYGKVLVIAGHGSSVGAAALSAKAAYRAGAGLVKVLTSLEGQEAVLRLVPEAVVDTYELGKSEERFLEPYSSEGVVGQEDLRSLTNENTEKAQAPIYTSIEEECRAYGIDAVKVVSALSEADSVAFGMGIGTDKKAHVLFGLVMDRVTSPLVLDADGINILAEIKSEINYEFRTPTVLTPHMKELSRLTGKDIAFLKDNVLSVASELGKEQNLTVVCKDAATVVSDGEELFINTTGNSGMSTGGSGDVLSGIAAAFAAKQESLFEPAAMAVYLHGHAGDIAALKLSEHAVMASDIVDALPEAMKAR